MTKIIAPRAGEKVARDPATHGQSKVYLGDAAPVVEKIAPRAVRAGDKVVRDEATRGVGKVYLGDAAPVCRK